MTAEEVLKKVENDEELTYEEVLIYEREAKPVKHVYGKYGNLARIYIENHNQVKGMMLGKDLPEYLHGIDRQASDMYDTMYAKYSVSERFKKTGDYLSDLRRETEMKNLIEEEILNELVYVD